MKKLLVCLIILLFSLNIKGENLPQISLLTCSSGSELYSSFGHSGLRIQYPDGEDIVYNFGLFDFDTPNFYGKFVMGKLKYMLGIQDIYEFIEIYEWENRTVFEQKLILTEEQTNAIIDRLNYLYEPENRYYFYSFLYKNCTSELRDLIFANVPVDNAFLEKSAGITYRKLLNQYINGWGKFGINLMLGSSLDRDISVFQSMFLPENLYDGLEFIDSAMFPFISERTILTKPETPKNKNQFLSLISSPNFVFFILLLILIALTIFNKSFYLNQTFHFIIGIIGLIIFIVMIFSEHVELYHNFNLLWCNPLYLLLAFSTVFEWRKLTKYISLILLSLLLIMPFLWLFKVQYAEISFIFIYFILLISTIQTYLQSRNK